MTSLSWTTCAPSFTATAANRARRQRPCGGGGGGGGAPPPPPHDRSRSVGGRPRPARTKGAERLGLAVGDDVVHAKWGEGVVIELSGDGEDVEATINFASVGEKRLYLAWAPLKRA
jgi:hypothetical protein